jgi:hypothetical protein
MSALGKLDQPDRAGEHGEHELSKGQQLSEVSMDSQSAHESSNGNCWKLGK